RGWIHDLGLLFAGLGGLDGLPHALGRERHGLDVIDAQRGQRVHHGVDHGGGGGDRAGLAGTLHPHGVDRGGRDRAVGLVQRKHVGLGHRVVHHAARHELAGFTVVHGAFPERLSHALRDAAVNHAVHDHGVDDVADVVHRDVAQDVHLAGVTVDLDHAGV